MSVNKLLPDDYRYYVEKFHRFTYRDVFERFVLQAQEALSAFSDSTQAKTRADQLVSRADSLISARRLGKKLRLNDVRQFFLLYLLPAIGMDARCGTVLVDAILDSWNERYPENRLIYISYPEICSGFRNTYMGFEIGERK